MMPIVILAGGLATRLRPITEKIPKSLVEVNAVPFVLHQLELLQKNGFSKIHFCLGYLGEMVEEVVKASPYSKSLEITFSYDGPVLLGTGGAIKQIIDTLPANFFVTYGDSYLDIPYQDVESFFQENRQDAQTGLMTVFKNEGKWDSSNVIFSDKKIKLYSKRNKVPEMIYIDYGLGIVSKNHFDIFSKGTTFDLSDIYEKLSITNDLLGYEVKKRFYEIGSFTGIKDITEYLNQNL